MDVRWVRFPSPSASWHIVEAEFVSRANRPLVATACGRVTSSANVRDERPGHERTCESCLRLEAPK